MSDFPEVATLTPEQLRKYIYAHHVADYQLIDVRESYEYAVGHIPGALFMPLSELEARLFDLPEDKELIFYCHSGGRSMAAAMLTMDAEVTQKFVANLTGGMVAWEGDRIDGFPRLDIFDNTADLETQLYTAMDLEKGAWRFYKFAAKLDLPAGPQKTFENLSKAETGHAKIIYGFWKPHQAEAPSFDALFSDLKGDVVEGGEDLAITFEKLAQMSGSPCMNLIEMALHIEYRAFDLYRAMAEKSEVSDAKEAFLTIAQAEKSHVKLLVNSVKECQGV